MGPVAGVPGDRRLLPERARDAAVLLPNAGHPRGRHPRHHGGRRWLLRPEDVHGQGRARGRHRHAVDRWPPDQVDRGSRREPHQRWPLAPGIHHGHRRGRRRGSAARRQGAPRRGRRRLPAPRERHERERGHGHVPGAVRLGWSRLGRVPRAGGLHQYLRPHPLPGALDDGDHRARADDGRRRREAGYRPAGDPQAQHPVQRGHAVHQPHADAVRDDQPGRDAGAGSRDDRLRRVPQGAGEGPRGGSVARHRPVQLCRAAVRLRHSGHRGGDHSHRAQRQGQRLHEHRQSRAEPGDDAGADRRR